MKRNLFFMSLVLMTSASLLRAEVFNGSCGSDLTWTLNTEDGALVIEGSGVMDNYNYQNTPWYNHQYFLIDGSLVPLVNCIKTITISEGVTSIGNYAFSYADRLTSITIPNSVTSIGYNAFEFCYSLRAITLPASITFIPVNAFAYSSVELIYVPCGERERFQSLLNGRGPEIKYFPSPYVINANQTSEGYIYIPDYSVCDDSIQVQANPNTNYHFVQWTDGIKENPRTISLDQDITLEAFFAYNPVITYICNSAQGYVSGDTVTPTGVAVADITFEAHPYRGYCFVRWADGNTDNPRTIKLAQDTTMEAIFDYMLTGKCGKDNALTWTLDTKKMALNITGKGTLSENYTYGKFIESLTIGNEITQIGEEAFYRFEQLKYIILGSSVKVLESEAFRRCSAIESITCYSQRPPTVNDRALDGLDYSTIVYVPADYLDTYKMHDAWGLYDVRPIGAATTETSEVEVTPSSTTADVTWPAVDGAATYELVIKDKEGNVICTLIFNAKGQLTEIAFNAPGRGDAPQKTQSAGFSFTITGLDSGTGYDLTIVSKDENGEALDEQTLSFTTQGDSPQALDQITNDQSPLTNKVIRNGQLLILRGEKTYTVDGREMR